MRKENFMLRFRPYLKSDAKHILSWVDSKDTFYKWSAGKLGNYPISADELNSCYQNFSLIQPFIPLTAIEYKTDIDRKAEQGGDGNHETVNSSRETVNGEIVGHITMRFVGDDKRIIRLGFVIINDKLRGRGIGRQMIETAIKYAYAIFNPRKVEIGVFEKNINALKCYRSSGFAPTEGKNESYIIEGKAENCLLLQYEK
jgi:RimJ/RimL family protein N-acetyltransferase